MTYREATKDLKRVGTAHATGDALKAMYADMVAFQHGGKAELYYGCLVKLGGDDQESRGSAISWMRDRAAAWEVLIG